MAELLIDCDEDRTLLAVLVGMSREGDDQTLATSVCSVPPEAASLVAESSRADKC